MMMMIIYSDVYIKGANDDKSISACSVRLLHFQLSFRSLLIRVKLMMMVMTMTMTTMMVMATMVIITMMMISATIVISITGVEKVYLCIFENNDQPN